MILSWQSNDLQALTGQQYCPAAAITHLESMFAGNESGLKKRSRAIVLLDEMDLLVTRNQGVSSLTE